MSISALTAACSVRTGSSELDKAIAEKAKYDSQVELQVANLRKMIAEFGGGTDLNIEYAINERLSCEYSNYRLDSAIRYSERNLEIAHIQQSREQIIESSLLLTRLYSSYGLFDEGKELLDQVRIDIPDEYIGLYYWYCYDFYEAYSFFSEREEHENKKLAYRDSLRVRAEIEGNPAIPETEDEYISLHQGFAEAAEWTSEYAMAAYFLGQYHEAAGQIDSAKHYYTLSAISDIRCSNKNQGALIRLARLYLDDKDYQKAYEYSRSTIEDAINGNMKIRTIRISELFKVINDAYQAKEAQNKRTMGISLGIICVLLTLVIVLLYYLNKEIGNQKRAEHVMNIATQNTVELNTRLQEQNETLQKANLIQGKYIAHFFEVSATYLSKMETYQHSLRKLMTSGKMDDLNRALKSQDMLDNELHEQYIMFDKIFLDLYPNFVEDFNSLLKQENKVILKPGELMNTELRIYALMRVGFSDSAKIASFLRCSMSTIYTYRTKSRNRSDLSREAFEAAVMKLGTSSKEA